MKVRQLKRQGFFTMESLLWTSLCVFSGFHINCYSDGVAYFLFCGSFFPELCNGREIKTGMRVQLAYVQAAARNGRARGGCE